MAKIRQIFTLEPDTVEELKSKCYEERISMSLCVQRLLEQYMQGYSGEPDAPPDAVQQGRHHTPNGIVQTKKYDPLEGIDRNAINKIRKAHNLPPV